MAFGLSSTAPAATRAAWPGHNNRPPTAGAQLQPRSATAGGPGSRNPTGRGTEMKRKSPIIRAVLLVGLIASAAFASPESPDFDRWEADMLAGRFPQAAEYAVSVAEYQATSAVWAYRAGASSARAGDTESALHWLSAAAERRYSGVRTFETDTDIDAVRDDPRFGAIIKTVRENAAARLASFQEAAGQAKPIIIKPPGFDPKTPTPVLLVLHGTGQAGKQMARSWRSAAARTGCVLITPDALRPAGKGYSWTFRDESEWYVEHLLEQARADFEVGPVILAGFSQGANIALAMGRSHPTLVDAVLPVCGHWESRVEAMPTGDDRPAWCLVIGEEDPWASTYNEAQTALADAGMRTHLVVVPKIGHAIPGARVLEESVAWCLEGAHGAEVP